MFKLAAKVVCSPEVVSMNSDKCSNQLLLWSAVRGPELIQSNLNYPNLLGDLKKSEYQESGYVQFQ